MSRCGFCTLTPPCCESCRKDRLTPELKVHIAKLEQRCARLDALEAAGVFNWEWYGDAMASLNNEDEH